MEQKNERINFASNLVRLRKKLGITQEQLASRLYVSGKTVSKWERGLGYPEISQLINLSDFFSVPIDRLLREEHYGIAIAGNILTDQVKTIDSYPERQMLASIVSVSKAVGGCVPNTAINLAKIDSSISISAIGRIGKDECGSYILDELQRNLIDTGNIRISSQTPTSFSDAMSVEDTGERTFFHYRGANAEFSPEDVQISSLNCKMLHIGYILLLDAFDREDPEYGTVMARFLADVQRAGIRTSIDVVSDNTGNFSKKVLPALKYTDNAIMNEIEGCASAGIEARDANGKLLTKNIRKAMEILLSQGVRERVILHCPEAGFILNRNGEFTAVPSLQLPAGFIKGSIGAGDAFCAGCLFGIYRELCDREILEFASGAAACNLTAEDSVSGMRSKEEIRKLIASFPRRDISFDC
ncbi:MAG: PfkB family carbohydrate kinase [Eubacteriales bacterium]